MDSLKHQNPYIMKIVSSVKITFLFLAGLGLLVSSCKKDEETNTPQNDPLFQGTKYWECTSIEVNPDTIKSLYFFTLTQSGNTLLGEAMVRDGVELREGVITGVVRQDSILFAADFEVDVCDFMFRGVAEDSAGQLVLSGLLETSPSSINGNDQVLLFICPIADSTEPQIFPNNPYVFRKVSASAHPGDSSVIFVHGMTGDLTNWDEIINLLSPEFKEKHDVYVFQYNWKDSIMINGRILQDSIQAAGLTNPIIVAHSMGGLVSRAYISQGGDIARLVALGTPHLGTPLANMSKLFIFAGFPGPRDMMPDGAFIQSLLVNPHDIDGRSKYVVFSGRMKGKFKIVKWRLKWVWAENYYILIDKLGYDAFHLFGNPPNDGLVPVSSGLFEGYTLLERKPILEWVDHRNLRTPTIAVEVIEYINGI